MKGQITSGYKYWATDANGSHISFGVTENGIIYRNINGGEVQPIPTEEVKGFQNVRATFEAIRIINGRVYHGTIMERDGELYTVSDAVDVISDDDDAFREWVDDNAEYVEIMGHSFYVDYDTICSWDIEDEIRSEWVDQIEEMLLDENIDGWSIYEDDNTMEVEFVILDNGTVVAKEDINREYITSLIDAMLAIDHSSCRFGDWVVTYDPIKSEAVSTDQTVPTEATVPTENQTTEPASNPDDERPRINRCQSPITCDMYANLTE